MIQFQCPKCMSQMEFKVVPVDSSLVEVLDTQELNPTTDVDRSLSPDQTDQRFLNSQMTTFLQPQNNVIANPPNMRQMLPTQLVQPPIMRQMLPTVPVQPPIMRQMLPTQPVQPPIMRQMLPTVPVQPPIMRQTQTIVREYIGDQYF